jgi:hypothetical protein
MRHNPRNFTIIEVLEEETETTRRPAESLADSEASPR